MAEYIEREAAIALYEDDAVDMSVLKVPVPVIIQNLKDVLAADVVPVVRGKWIPDYDYTEYDYDGSTPLPEPRKFQDGWQCSLCGGYMPSETNFCPNCGARMDGDGE